MDISIGINTSTIGKGLIPRCGSSLTLSGFGLGRLIVGKGEYRGCKSAINTFLAILLPLAFVFFSWIPGLVGIRCFFNLLIMFMDPG